MRSKPRVAIRTCSLDVFDLLTLNPRLQLGHHLICRKLGSCGGLRFKACFHFLNDLLPRCVNECSILFPVLAGGAFEDRGAGNTANSRTVGRSGLVSYAP